MGLQPKITGTTVERSYENYRNNIFLVNRRYQRKLVWTISEKQAFIDSLINGYPVPSFLFASSTHNNQKCEEIIDGMQRLNAIFSFIENDYSTSDGNYFDLSATAITKQLLDCQQLSQKEPILDRSSSVSIASYELPFSIYEENSPDIIDEVFRRINSNGKHLSRQEIRQAGATGDFAQLVRELATKLRGDVSHDDVLLLSKMRDISIQQDDESFSNSGIKAEDVFWVKENIIQKKDLRLSVDEEIIADLLGAILSDEIPPSRISVLDSYYELNDDATESRGTKVENALKVRGKELVSSQFLRVIDEIKKIFCGQNTTIIKHILEQNQYRGPRYFQALFLTMFDLLIKKEMKIRDYKGLFNKLHNISNSTMKIAAGGGAWSAIDKKDLIAANSAVLKEFFEETGENDPMLYPYSTEIETLLRQSQTENTQYDFKQGIYNLQTGERNDELVNKIFKTLSCMGNSGKMAKGYVLIGVADNKKDADIIKEKYGDEYIKVGNFYITGINGEVKMYCNSDYDSYFAYFRNAIQQLPMDDHYKRQIGAKIRMVNYNDKTVIIVRIETDNGAVRFGDSYYTRLAANNNPIPVTAAEMPAFFAKFQG